MPEISINQNARRHARSRSALAPRPRGLSKLSLVLLALPAAGCFQPLELPDQTPFATLSSLSGGGQAVVRVYGAPIPFFEGFAIHTWIVTKRSDELKFHRWEIWLCPEGDYNLLCKDFSSPASGIGRTPTFVIGELVGTEAEAVVAFVEEMSPLYPFRDRYVPVPGPNSNTYTQWVLDNNGWDLELRPRAVGADWNPPRGWPVVSVDQD